MANFSELILTLPHTSIAAIAWGPKHGQPILAVHGWLDNAASFIPLIPYLQGYRVVAIDLPGHGLSAHIPAGHYLHLVDYIVDIIRILDHLNWDRATLLGHSLGAGISSVVAGTVPERIVSLALLDGIGTITATPATSADMMRTAVEHYTNKHAKKLPYYANMEDAIIARSLASSMQRKSIELLISRGLKNTEHGLTWRTDPRLLFSPLVLPTEEQLESFLQRISAATCFIRPETGWPYDEEMLNNRLNIVKNIKLHSIPGRHHVHMDSPELVGPILYGFFANQ